MSVTRERLLQIAREEQRLPFNRQPDGWAEEEVLVAMRRAADEALKEAVSIADRAADEYGRLYVDSLAVVAAMSIAAAIDALRG